MVKSWPLGRRTGPGARTSSTSPAGACRVMPGLRVRRDTTGIVIVDHHDQSGFADDQKHRDVGLLTSPAVVVRERLSVKGESRSRANEGAPGALGARRRTFVLDELSEQCNGRVPQADLAVSRPGRRRLPRPKSQRGWFAGAVKRARARSTPPGDGDRRWLAPVMIAGRHPRTSLCAIRANTTPRSRPRTISSAAIRPGDHRCVDVHRTGSVGPSPPVLSSSNNPARANSKPLTINTQTGNAIVIHMLTLLATSNPTAAR